MKTVAEVKPTPAESALILKKAQREGVLPEGYVERELAAIRGVTGGQARTAAGIEGRKELSPEESAKLLSTLKSRFVGNQKLHPKIQWAAVEKSLQSRPDLMWSLNKLEETGGEPDVFMEEGNDFVFGDCSAESPAGRRNVVFDKEAEQYASGFNGNAVDMAAEMGVDLMDEAQYHALQKLTPVDASTWSWLRTSADMRKSGDALDGYRDGSSVDVGKYDPNDHADSRAFRAALRVPKVA